MESAEEYATRILGEEGPDLIPEAVEDTPVDREIKEQVEEKVDERIEEKVDEEMQAEEGAWVRKGQDGEEIPDPIGH